MKAGTSRAGACPTIGGRCRGRAGWTSSSDLLLVLRRGSAKTTTSAPCDPDEAAKSLVAGTYMAGELRRYWAFASTLALGTGVGDIHPKVDHVAADFDRRTPLSRSHSGRISRHAAGQPRIHWDGQRGVDMTRRFASPRS